jgi:hypothetical protein
MDNDDLFRLLSGAVPRIVVGRLPLVAVSILRSQTVEVMLTSEVALAITRKHPDITRADLLAIPDMIARGLLIHEKSRPNRFVSCYQVPDSKRRFALAMKLARGRHEAWVSTLHRLGERQTKRYLARGVIIKRHK